MIESLKFGKLTIDGKVYENDVAIFPSGEIKPWWRKEGSRCTMDDLEEVLKSGAKRIIIGNGLYRMMGIVPTVRAAIESKGLKLDIYQSEQAVTEFNKSQKDGNVALCLHIRE
ncbi:MAG: MTH938/NDUFAF3 family protein [bacterium]|nr:MTH938/NDUFAF3 family protein [bacterium]